MKHNTQTIDLEQDLTLTINPDWQTKPFQISGVAETILPYAEAVQALDRSHPVKHTAQLGRTAVAAPESAVAPILEGRRASIAAKVFDVIYHDTSYQELKARRLAEKRLQHRIRIGTIVSDRCAKHERLLAKV